jgi:hypothetical protein
MTVSSRCDIGIVDGLLPQPSSSQAVDQLTDGTDVMTNCLPRASLVDAG